MAEKKSIATHLAEYIENTSIHGIKYLGEKKRPITEKTFWIVIFAVSFIFLGLFVHDVLTKFHQKSVILVEDDRPTPIHSIPFPAVTICPAVKIKNKFLPLTVEPIERVDMQMISELAKLICNQQFISAMLEDPNTDYTKYLNTSTIELLHQISPSLNDVFRTVMFASKFEFPKHNVELKNETQYPFSYILTSEGVCFTFNVPSEITADEPTLQNEYKYHNISNESRSWDNEYGYYKYPRFPRSVWGSGINNGLRLILSAKTEDLFTICQPTQNGYTILLHSPDEYPTTLDNFISIPHGTMTKIKVTPKITKTSNDLRWNLDPQMRQCFFNHERKLKYFTYYNRVNCKLECLATYTMQRFGCVHFSLPRTNSQPICDGSVKIDQMYDTEENINSYFQYKAEIIKEYGAEIENDEHLDFKNFSNFNCNCLPSCNSLEYDYSIVMDNIELEKVEKKYSSGNETNKIPAITILDIYFGMTKVTGKTRKLFYTFSDLIANIGGLMGLFMGASIISICEMIYYLFVR